MLQHKCCAIPNYDIYHNGALMLCRKRAVRADDRGAEAQV